jgi:hypothetical protein
MRRGKYNNKGTEIIVPVSVLVGSRNCEYLLAQHQDVLGQKHLRLAIFLL